MAATTAQRPSSGIAGAINDLIEGAKLWRLWVRLGLYEVQNRYKRTILGPFWMAATTIAMGLALAFVRSGPSGSGFGSLLPYVVSGVVAWALVGGGHTEGANTFISAAGVMRSTPLPLSFHVFLQVWRMLIQFAHAVVGFYLVTLPFGLFSMPHWTLPIGFALDVWAVFPSFFLLGLVAARYRDVGHAAGFVFSILFFLSPIFWQEANPSGLRALFVHHNPFAHLVNMLRSPLLGAAPTNEALQWVVGYGVVCWVLLLIVLPTVRRRVIFWL